MAEDIKQRIGLRIRAARQHAGLTQEVLATRVDRTPESISNIERGLQLPSLDTLIELGRTLGLPIAEFFEADARSPAPSAKRIELEARLREIGRALTDHELAVAVALVGVLLKERL